MPKSIRTTCKPSGIGRAIEKDREKRAKQPEQRSKATGVAERQSAKSVLDQSALDEFIAVSELAQVLPEVESNRNQVDEGPRIVSVAGTAAAVPTAVKQASALNVVVPVPRRPAWEEDMDADELADHEGIAFLEWRRGLVKLEEHDGVVMTPYEKNLDFWRQLWRTIDRSDVLVQILDARDPMFYRSRDLESYVAELGKRHLLLLNKADFLPLELREEWRSYFASVGVEAVFFSALRELHKMHRVPGSFRGRAESEGNVVDDDVAENEGGVPKSATALPPHGAGLLKNERDVLDCAGLLEALRARLPSVEGDGQRAGTVGFVGYPNVGKSSVINALFGAKKVSMSRTPGKTKHLQTLDIPESGITLCDCPGLVFPSVVATRAHLAINGVVPLTELRDHLPSIRLVVEKVGMNHVVEKYGLTAADLKEGVERRGEQDTAGALLAGFALSRKKLLRQSVPDEAWAARRVLRDYCTGALLCCEPPPSEKPAASSDTTTAVAPSPAVGTVAESPVDEADGSDFSDLDDFLNPQRDASNGRRGAQKKKKGQSEKKGGAKGGYPVPSS